MCSTIANHVYHYCIDFNLVEIQQSKINCFSTVETQSKVQQVLNREGKGWIITESRFNLLERVFFNHL